MAPMRPTVAIAMVPPWRQAHHRIRANALVTLAGLA
jgi:hypothetical protein